MSAQLVIAVLIAGVIGALARYGTSLAFARHASFPWAVFVVNVVASTIGGAALGLAYRGVIDPDSRLVLLSGICAGLSTFSTWSVETVQLVQAGRWRVALGSVVLNLAVSIGFATLAFLLAR